MLRTILLTIAAAFAFTASASNPASVTVKDVETLNDDLLSYKDKKVTVTGEIKDRIDKSSFVLESGGILNDEIVVITNAKAKDKRAAQFSNLKDDQKVTVTGTLRTASIVELRKELSWDLDSQIEAELQDVKAVIVADTITKKED